MPDKTLKRAYLEHRTFEMAQYAHMAWTLADLEALSDADLSKEFMLPRGVADNAPRTLTKALPVQAFVIKTPGFQPPQPGAL